MLSITLQNIWVLVEHKYWSTWVLDEFFLRLIWHVVFLCPAGAICIFSRCYKCSFWQTQVRAVVSHRPMAALASQADTMDMSLGLSLVSFAVHRKKLSGQVKFLVSGWWRWVQCGVRLCCPNQLADCTPGLTSPGAHSCMGHIVTGLGGSDFHICFRPVCGQL